MAENLGIDLSESEMDSEDIVWLNDTEAEKQGYEDDDIIDDNEEVAVSPYLVQYETEDIIEDQTEDLGLDLAEEYYEVIGEESDDDE